MMTLQSVHHMISEDTRGNVRNDDDDTKTAIAVNNRADVPSRMSGSIRFCYHLISHILEPSIIRMADDAMM